MINTPVYQEISLGYVPSAPMSKEESMHLFGTSVFSVEKIHALICIRDGGQIVDLDPWFLSTPEHLREIAIKAARATGERFVGLPSVPDTVYALCLDLSSELRKHARAL